MSWFVLRDLKRSNAKERAYNLLESEGIRVFTPFTTKLHTQGAKKTRERVPVIPDLLFAQAEKNELDPIILQTPTLQYRYAPGQNFQNPMTVRPEEMHRFITAIESVEESDVKYLTPEELSRANIGSLVKIADGGPLDGYEGRLLSIRGSKKRRLLVELPGILTAAIEISPSYIQLLP